MYIHILKLLSRCRNRSSTFVRLRQSQQPSPVVEYEQNLSPHARDNSQTSTRGCSKNLLELAASRPSFAQIYLYAVYISSLNANLVVICTRARRYLESRHCSHGTTSSLVLSYGGIV